MAETQTWARPRPITKKQAQAVLRYIERVYVPEATAGDCPFLKEPGTETSGWCVAWEGHWGWSIDVAPAVTREFSGVFAEPVNGWCLGLYRADGS